MWKPVVGYEELYEVSNEGVVRSFSRLTMGRWGKPKTTPGRVMKPELTNVGYLRVSLSRDGKSKHKSIHRIVAEAFISSVEGKADVNHINNIKTDNRVENLEWCTAQENTIHMRKLLKKNNRSMIVPECTRCHTTKAKYNAKGLCHNCYQKEWMDNKRSQLRQLVKERMEK